jgi:probable HAF family extracellular repeat protein
VIRSILKTSLAMMALSLCLSSGLHCTPIHRVSYSVTDIGTLDGSSSRARAINNNAEIVGDANVNPSNALSHVIKIPVNHAFLWKHGHMIDLDQSRTTDFSVALGVNDKGVCIGSASSPNMKTLGVGKAFACLWRGHDRQILGTFGGDIAFAQSINDKDMVCGFAKVAGTEDDHAFVWQQGRMIDLTPGSGKSGIANSLNNHDQIVGFVRDDTSPYERAIIWFHHKTIFLSTPPGDKYSEARSVNNFCEIVGDIGDGFTRNTAALWTSPKRCVLLDTLGRPSSIALSINNQGQIVGRSETSSRIMHACLWQRGKVIDLNNAISAQSGWLLQSATSINDHGEIVGFGLIKGRRHAFLLTPQHH